MVKILHSALMLRPVSGIVNQMKAEKIVVSELGLDWGVKIFCSKNYSDCDDDVFQYSTSVNQSKNIGFLRRASNYIGFRREYYLWLTNQARHCDIILLRYSTSDPFQPWFIRRCEKPVYLIHHTLEIPELRGLGGVGSLFRVLVEKFFGRLSYHYSKGFVGVTDEILERRPREGVDDKKNVYRYANGINSQDFSLLPSGKLHGVNEVPVLIFVASYFSPWHGLDLLFDDIKKSNRKFLLHVVGGVDEKERAGIIDDERVIFHGHVSQEELNSLISKSDLGLSSFALWRQDMKEACPLKTREYLAQGLAVYSGHKDIFPDDNGFFKVGKPSIDEILSFQKQISYKSRSEISSAARPYIEKSKLVGDFYLWLTIQV